VTHEEIAQKRQAERDARHLFKKQYQVEVKDNETKLPIGKNSTHKFDLFALDKFIGGITTSPWKNKSGSNNTGGQDRASTELLWLTLWSGEAHRVMILTDQEMASKLLKRWQGCPFPHRIEIIHCDLNVEKLYTIGVLG